MVEWQLPKLHTWVRFPSPAPFFLSILILPSLLFAEAPKPAEPPPGLDFVRTLDLEGYIQETQSGHSGSDFARLQTRYLDPDVNAFVGLLTRVGYFNRELAIGDPNNPTNSSILWDWGGGFGIVRGAHLWEIDLMGSALHEHIAFAPGLVGEHALGAHWEIFHRTVGHFFKGDTVLDSDQGVAWFPIPQLGITAGYRIFAAQHLNRNGPRIGLIFHLQSPKVPFLFPSMG